MFSRLDSMSDHTERASGGIIFITTKNIEAPLYCVLKLYADLKALNLPLSSVVRYFLIHRTRILDLTCC